MEYNRFMNRTGGRAQSEMIIRNGYEKELGIKYYLVVEGETDVCFFQRIINPEKCAIKPLKGKPEVISFIKEQNKNKKNAYLGVVDADFDHLDGKKRSIENLIETDEHDIEMLILKSNPDIYDLYAEYVDMKGIVSYEKNHKNSFLDDCMAAAYQIGLVRYAIHSMRLESNMKDIPYEEYVNEEFKVNQGALVKALKGPHDEGTIMSEVIVQEKKKHDNYQLTCGHDVAGILECAFKGKNNNGLGYGKQKYFKDGEIERAIRFIYDYAQICETTMFKQMQNWTEKHDRMILKEGYRDISA